MKHIALMIYLSALCVMNFVFAFYPELSRRYFRSPKSSTARKVIHLAFGILFLLGVLMVFYALLDPRGTA